MAGSVQTSARPSDYREAEPRPSKSKKNTPKIPKKKKSQRFTFGELMSNGPET